jgi:hypothetical protein
MPISLIPNDDSDNNKIDPAVIKALEALGPTAQKILVNKLLGKKVSDPYYNEASALSIKAMVDEMIEDECDRRIEQEDFPEYKLRTLRQKLYSGLQYLVQHMDPTGKYKVFNSRIMISMPQGNRILVRFVEEGATAFFTLRAHKILPTRDEITEDNSPTTFTEPTNKKLEGGEDWRSKLLELISELEVDKSATISELKISQSDIEYVKNLFYDLEDFTIIIRKTSIKVIRSRIEGLDKVTVKEDE